MISFLRSIAMAFALSAVVGAAFAGPAEDAKALIAKGQFGEALTILDQHLSKNPQDAAARFNRGVALIKLNRTNEAIKAFADLTRDFPQLPEPYNNLAVIYAQQGDYEKARTALEAALAAHPSYAPAHENLGDVYAALAGASYNRALLIDQGNQGLRGKIAMLSKIDHSPVLAAVPMPTAEAASASVAAAKPLRKGKKPEPQVAEPEQAAAEATPAESTESSAADGKTKAAIADALLAWTRAWSSKDLAAYFAAYADDFAPEGGAALEDWQQQRKDRILKPSRIQVEARNVEFTKTGPDQVRVKFVQQYESDTFSDAISKIVEMKRVDGAWKITREYAR